MEKEAPSTLLRTRAAEWLAEQGIACNPAQLRLPLDLRYGDVVLPAHVAHATPRESAATLALRQQEFEWQHDGSGNLQLTLLPSLATLLLEAVERDMAVEQWQRAFDLLGDESEEIARAVIRVEGLWHHCVDLSSPLQSNAPFDLLHTSPNAYRLARLLLRRDRVRPGTDREYAGDIAHTIGDIYHHERVIPADRLQRDAWLRLLRLACSAFRV